MTCAWQVSFKRTLCGHNILCTSIVNPDLMSAVWNRQMPNSRCQTCVIWSHFTVVGLEDESSSLESVTMLVWMQNLIINRMHWGQVPDMRGE